MSVCGCVEGCQLTDRFTPATRELMVFTKDPKRYFDLDAVRTETVTPIEVQTQWQTKHVRPDTGSRADDGVNHRHGGNPAGAPPLDWWQIPSPKPQPVTEYQGDPMTATFYVGDAIETMNKLPAKSVDLILTSPPFLALRSYLPADHPDKALEGGSQATPGAFIDWLIDVVEACDRVLAPHGSLCIELGDTYAGSGGAGGDYDPGAWRQGQPAFEGSSKMARVRKGEDAKHPYPINPDNTIPTKGTGWPLAKSLSLIPELFRLTLVYGVNPLTGRTTDRWRLRNVVRWVRPNPPVGALGDKFRPATSELMVFCKSAKRYFDLDAVREPHNEAYAQRRFTPMKESLSVEGRRTGKTMQGIVSEGGGRQPLGNPAGAPPLDWWNIPLLEGEEETRYGPKPKPEHPHGGWPISPKYIEAGLDSGSRKTRNHPDGVPPLDWWNIPPGGYEGAHYAVMPPELCIKPIKAMCPEKVCRQCGEPSRRIVESERIAEKNDSTRSKYVMVNDGTRRPPELGWEFRRTETGFSDCGHGSIVCQSCKVLVPYDHAIQRSRGQSPVQGGVGQEEVLGEPGEGSGLDAEASEGVPDLRGGLLGPNGDESSLQPLMFGEVGTSGRADEHAAASPKRVGASASRRTAGSDLRSGLGSGGLPGATSERLDDGASGADAGTSRPAVGVVGVGPPSERQQDGQPDRESTDSEPRPTERPGGLSELPASLRGSLAGYVCPCGSTDFGYVADHWRPGMVLDPFGGSGTTALVATGHGRDCILIDLDERNYELALQRVGPFILSRAESV